MRARHRRGRLLSYQRPFPRPPDKPNRGEIPGGNGGDVYVDIAAVRSGVPADELGLENRVTEVWERYRLPVAAGEVHNGCTRDEQLRWFVEGWQAARNCLAKGVDVRAVTAWALFGSFDWNSSAPSRQTNTTYGRQVHRSHSCGGRLRMSEFSSRIGQPWLGSGCGLHKRSNDPVGWRQSSPV